MAESADRQAWRESLERELQNVRSNIRALREAVGTTPEQNEAVFQLERAHESMKGRSDYWRRSPNWTWARIRWEPGKEKPAEAGLQGGGPCGGRKGPQGA